MLQVPGRVLAMLVCALAAQVEWPEADIEEPVEPSPDRGCVFEIGHMEPIALGLEACPDGLLVDLVEGLTFQYRRDDVRLLGVREGRLSQSGGPTGPVWYLRAGGDPGATFQIERGGGTVDLLASAPSMIVWPSGSTGEVRHLAPCLRYLLETTDGTVVAHVDETLRAVPTKLGRGFVRSFVIKHEGPAALLVFDVLDQGELVPESGVISSGPPRSHDWSLRGVGRAQSAVHRYGEQRVLNVWARPPGQTWRAGRLAVDLAACEKPLRIEVATFVLDEWSLEIERELGAAMRR